jgi:hypothetical protein
MAVDEFAAMLGWDPTQLLGRLALVAGTIADLVTLHAEARSQELEDKARGWSSSGEDTVRGREKASTFAAVSASQTRFETEAQLDALREEKEFIVFLIGVKQKEIAHVG